MTDTMTRRAYWIDNQRGFANEYTLAVTALGVPVPDHWQRITRQKWIYALRLRHDHAGAIARFGDRYVSSEIEAAIDRCQEATEAYLSDPSEGYSVSRLANY